VGLPADTVRPGHGSYKPSQLLVRDGAVFLVDFDQFCLADPALDIGYFLAYLRPAGLWYHRAGRRAWFEAAADAFLTTYLDRLAERGESAATCAGIAGRAPVFEAALLLKIAARRANRLHSPRTGEVAAVLDEVSRSLALGERPGTSVS
jgi:thiamine kinase-like enzyme